MTADKQQIERVEIVMPIGSDPDFLLKQASIRRGATKAGFCASFPAYQLLQPTFQISALIDHMRGAAVVLADVTGERPSCYYEVGVAEALGIPTLLVAKTGTAIHQAGARCGARFYSDLDDLEQVVASLLSDHVQTRAAVDECHPA